MTLCLIIYFNPSQRLSQDTLIVPLLWQMASLNRLDVESITKHFRLKQIVKKPTRRNAILGLALTNLHTYYDEPRSFPPFGVSDHNIVTAQP